MVVSFKFEHSESILKQLIKHIFHTFLLLFRSKSQYGCPISSKITKLYFNLNIIQSTRGLKIIYNSVPLLNFPFKLHPWRHQIVIYIYIFYFFFFGGGGGLTKVNDKSFTLVILMMTPTGFWTSVQFNKSSAKPHRSPSKSWSKIQFIHHSINFYIHFYLCICIYTTWKPNLNILATT